ncbi:hypothetical protein VTJ04DRAFT_2656 [Mycothermus thermophilus]|uniref:uncharacterized protein n=1 Tax=Humicola insolens TaxID=85995 RepID=UPI0037421623
MADPARYRYMPDAGGRRSPPPYNPARASMPVTATGYSLYAGDLHAMSASHHEGMTRPSDDYPMSPVPSSSGAFSGRDKPVGRSTSVTDTARSHHRAVDHPNRPVIVTKHAGPVAALRSGSPSRDPYRASDEGPYYAEPASSIPRGRPPPLDDDDYRRLRERTHQDRLATRGPDTFRPPRPASLYAGGGASHRTGPHHTFEFSDDAYEYTKPSDLARYDLEHDRRPNRTRRPSVDRYYRPTVSISTELARPFDLPERRHGPPPTTRGLDKINWGPTAGGIYDGAGARMPMPPSIDTRPDPRRPVYDTPGSPRARPYVEDYYDDDPYYYHRPGDVLDRDIEYFQDDRVTARGFGILVDADDLDDRRQLPEKIYHDDRRDRRDRRETQKRYEVREPRRRSDEDDLEIIRYGHDDREHRRRHRDRDYSEDEDDRDRKDRRKRDDEADNRDDKARDRTAGGLGIVAGALGLSRKKNDRDRDESPPRRRKDAEDSKSRKEPLLGDEEFEIVEHPRDREKGRDEKEPERDAKQSKESKDNKDRKEAKQNGKSSSPRDESPSSDDEKSKSRRRQRDSGFDPNDTATLAEIKAKLAETEVKDNAKKKSDETSSSKDKDKDEKDRPATSKDNSTPTKEDKSSSPEKRDSDNKDKDASAVVPKKEESRELVTAPAREEKQVRVVPPPKDNAPAPEKKPIKGILKQPRAHFPEEPNPVREGVAPNKNDKSKADVPPGARWTKISRKLVNPEALRIGNERFEVRDDFVIVLRVLSKDEIQAYAQATATLRERRRKELERAEREARNGGANDDRAAEYDEERDRRDDDDEKKQRHAHRQHRRGREEDERDRREREERHRRHARREEDEEDVVGEVRRAHYRGYGRD